MLVETRREDFAPQQPAMPPAAPEAADQGGALRDLIAAALVSHEAIGDPDRLAGGEAAALRALCRHVAGPVYRVAPYHYAFAAGPEAAAALVARLAAEIGPEALWIATLDHLAAPAAAPEGPPAAALLLLQARATATEAGLAAAGPEMQAVIDARYAVECARLTAGAAEAAGAGAAALAARLDALEARLETGLAAIAEEAARSHARSAAREAERETALETFETRVGLALAEFLARLEARDAVAATGAAG
ncbi:hypothetical protein [Amaricoccus sp.]|uniref:hypothetical protein n=1 Tax=Amaricoccus sp. TaxID=1872485 RepID=UPI001B7178A3|nr:hypothetical protein [Amaricoccus sp.]MBP7003142.1 hypothetical protein [Amaricoccus sp.]